VFNLFIYFVGNPTWDAPWQVVMFTFGVLFTQLLRLN